MSHPLAPILNDLSDEELTSKLSELHGKYVYAAARNNYLARQILSLIDDYNNEMMRRNAEMNKRIEEELGEDFFSDNIKIK